METQRYAAIDIGTVTCRLLLADVAADGHLDILERGYAITNLGEGVDASGMLRPDAIQRVADQVARYRERIDAWQEPGKPPIRVVATATSAARDARNADEFVAKLASYGVRPKVIPGSREAALTFLGAASDFPGETLLVADIGGGSTELVIGTAGHEPLLAHSFDIGCRRVTERFFRADPPSQDEKEQADAWMRAEFAPFFRKAADAGIVLQRFVAVAGTATTVVSVDREMAEYDSDRVHRQVITRPVLEAVAHKLASVPLAQRTRIIGLDPGRAPVIVAGMLILQAVMDLSGQDEYTASESDILQGLILDDVRERKARGTL
ncbi:MAG: Ppx/GppA family phosphatase [Eggerthellaceae bacterium]|jgi:exopolyphosphatase/guanosine-5'-triphosphate,3'-diphosphate pyrophosphatase